MPRICGIDPGKRGGLAIVIASENKIDIEFDACQKMPLKKTDHAQEVCFASIAKYLKKYRPDMVCIEKVHAMPGQGVVSMFTFGYGYGGIVGCCEALKIPIMPIHSTTWKRILFEKEYKAGNVITKSDTIAYCQTRFGKQIPKHDGITDAICIALCGIKKFYEKEFENKNK